MIRSNSTGRSGFRRTADVGIPSRIALKITPELSPRNGSVPVAISYSTAPNSLWCKSGFRNGKRLCDSQGSFVESAHGDGHAQAAGEARGVVDRAAGVGISSGTSVLPEAERVAGGRALRRVCRQPV